MIQSTPLGPVDGQASCLMILMRCAAVPIDATVRLVDLGPMTPPPTAWARLPIRLMPTAGKGCVWSATRRLLN